MVQLLPKKIGARIAVILVALTVLLGGGYAGAKWIAWPYIKAWREQRTNGVARDYLAKGDYANAMVSVRKTLQYNNTNVDAWKLSVEIAEKQDSSNLYVYQLGLANVQPTLDNKLKLIRVAIKYGAFTKALETINKMGPEASQSAEFFELATQVSQRMGQVTKSKFYLMSLVKLRPDDRKARFDLAQIRLLEGFAENKPALRSEIRAIASESPELRTRALSLLLADALEAKNEADAITLADELAAQRDIGMSNQTSIAEAYRLYAPKRFPDYVQQLQRQADSPEKVVTIVSYLAAHELASETRLWLDTLPETLKSAEPVQVTYAFCLLKLNDLPALETFLRTCKWTDNEYARQALLAYRYRQNNDERAFNESWKLAVIEVGNNPRTLQRLFTQVTLWNWPEQKIELVWKKFNLDPSDKKARQQLGAWERAKNNTLNLNRLFGRIVEFDPSDSDYRNNFTYTSLLLGNNPERAHNDARDLHRANPKNPFYATTYALSLYKQGKAQEALNVFESMGPAMVAMPERILLHSVLLIANGRIDEGVDQSTFLKLDQFLPQERSLFTEASATVARSRRDQASAARLSAITDPGTSDRNSWLATLPASFRKSSVQLELADSLYANDDFAGLESTLKGEKWEENDFLRQALLAYALRKRGKEGDSRSLWRITVSAAGNRPLNLSVLEDMTERWGWTQEHLEILNRLLQRDPLDSKIFDELVDAYNRSGQTGDLARIYGLRVENDAADAETKSRFAYYSLLTGGNIARAHILARESHDADPTNAFRAKTYALSLLKQSRTSEGWRLLEKFPDKRETGPAQLSLLKAALALQQDDTARARTLLNTFDATTALPEETALAESLTKTLAQKSN